MWFCGERRSAGKNIVSVLSVLMAMSGSTVVASGIAAGSARGGGLLVFPSLDAPGAGRVLWSIPFQKPRL